VRPCPIMDGIRSAPASISRAVAQRVDTIRMFRPKQTIHQFVRGRALTRPSTDTTRPVAKHRHLIRGMRVKW
jgi:hypothetical protein